MTFEQQDKFSNFIQILKTKDLTKIEPEFLANDQIKESLMQELEKIESQDLDYFVEGWTNEGLASTYFTVM